MYCIQFCAALVALFAQLSRSISGGSEDQLVMLLFAGIFHLRFWTRTQRGKLVSSMGPFLIWGWGLCIHLRALMGPGFFLRYHSTFGILGYYWGALPQYGQSTEAILGRVAPQYLSRNPVHWSKHLGRVAQVPKPLTLTPMASGQLILEFWATSGQLVLPAS